ncbi:MAG TPA: DUF4034 domain-containing protein [Alphaproteobacteria bacterium]
MVGRRTRRRIGRAVGLVGVVLALALAAAPVCALDYADKLDILDMLRRGSLTKLETWLAAYQNAFENGRASDRLVDHAYSAFANSDPELAETLDRWLDKRPESYAALLARGTYYAHLVWIVRGTVPADKIRPASRRAMGEFLDLARRDLEAAVARKPRLSAAYARLITAHKWLGNASDAEFVMRKGLDLVPGSFVIRAAYLDSLVPWWRAELTVAKALQDISGFMKEVEYSAQRYPDLRPLLGYPDFVSGELLSRAGRYDAAGGYLDRALSHGAFWMYHFERGVTFALGGQHVFALQRYDRALALRPQAAEILAQRGWAYWGLDNRSQAIVEWDQALALDALEPGTLAAKATALEALGRSDEALAAYDKAVFYGAYDRQVRAGRGTLRLHRFGDFAGAVEDLRVATELAPDQVGYWHDYGLALVKMNACDGDAAAALATYIRLCRDNGGCPEDRLIWAAGTVERITAGDCTE